MLALHNNTVGLVQFRPNISEAARTNLISQRPLSLLIDDQEWDITANRYRKLTEDQTFEVIAALHAKKLKISHKYGIQDGTKPQEFYINLSLSHSLDFINCIQMETTQKTYKFCLQFHCQIYVCSILENNICQLRSLRKCHIPSLEQLTFYKNKVIDFMPIFELHAPALRIIWTTPQNESFDSSDLSWVFRLQSNKINKLFVKHERSQPFNLDPWKQMVKHVFPKAKHIYRIQDDIALRLE